MRKWKKSVLENEDFSSEFICFVAKFIAFSNYPGTSAILMETSGFVAKHKVIEPMAKVTNEALGDVMGLLREQLKAIKPEEVQDALSQEKVTFSFVLFFHSLRAKKQ